MKKKKIPFLLFFALVVVISFGGCSTKNAKTQEVEEKKEIPKADTSGMPEYVISEVEKVARKVEAVRNEKSFVTGFVADLHTNGEDQSAESALHAGMAVNLMKDLTNISLIANLGDIAVGKFDDEAKVGFDHVRDCFYDVANAIPYIQLQGNHDELPEDSTEVAREKYYDYIGANNIGVIVDENNKFRNYGYKDFEEQKKRIIYVNTADVSDSEIKGDSYVTAEQLSWIVNVALDFSDKSDEKKWTYSVYSHHPLTWNESISTILTVLDAYKGKTKGSVVLDGKEIPFDFTNVKAQLIAHYHGHLHNFRVDQLGLNRIASITVPNTSFDRNNEYGTVSEYGEFTNRTYGDVGIDGEQRAFVKTAESEEDTSLNIIVEDLENEKIYCFNYGAGIDRVVDFEGNVVEPGDTEIVDDKDDEHNYSAWIFETVPSPESGGIKYKQCVDCGNRVIEIVDQIDKVAITGASLTLEDNLTIDFKSKLEFYRKTGYKNPRVVFDYNDTRNDVTYYSVVGKNNEFTFSDIAPNQMNNKIVATICAEYNDKEYSSEPMQYSVADYCYNMLEKDNASEDEAFRTLLVDLLEFGAESQIYTEYKTDELVNQKLTDEQKTWGTKEERQLYTVQNANYKTIDNPSAEWISAGLNLKDRVQMRFRIDTKDIEGLTVQVVMESAPEWIQTITMESFEKTEGGYYIFYNGLNAGQMSETVYLTVCKNGVPISNTLRYSIESYAYTQLNKENPDKELVSLLKAMIKYGDAAYNYINNKE